MVILIRPLHSEHLFRKLKFIKEKKGNDDDDDDDEKKVKEEDEEEVSKYLQTVG